ncbi:YlbF family regulator [Blautia schinkii]|uniref:YlbF family regulator n=1 Tax=Blautia schinkii TaxID=180164 RepID=UPI001571523D|nr:YlbF family regulator [Blautia schinkii]NSG81614.1 YlbF family regulator [Blautia schinkii]NSK22214.1 YlbF family regulator [Blautia schinkii]NSK25430.1 YlbF family regulator [Blautia schinkii]NSK31479.1 YlbF family regulator [Blautia schinkii]NSK48004.1 YlbF family regulator [Blautia schinkii]
MDEISMDIEKLLDAVHRSSEYQEYQKQTAQLDKDPELKARVMRFRGDNFRLQSQANQDELFHAAEQLNQESASLRQNQRVNAYLDAELALCRLMQRICRTLVAGIDIQIPDL